MATRQQALQITLQELNNISIAVQRAYESWQANINVKSTIIVAPIRANIQAAIQEISKIRNELDDAQANALLGLIVEKLTIYSDVLTGKVFAKPEELLTAWQKTLGNLLRDIQKSLPEAAKIGMFTTLSKAA